MSEQWHGGKGSKTRKMTVDRAKYEENYHRIFGHKDTSNRCMECSETDGQHTNECIYSRTTGYINENGLKEKEDYAVTENGQDWYDGDLGNFG